MKVIGDQEMPVLSGERQEHLEVLGRAALSDHDRHALAVLLLGLLQAHAFVVGRDARCDVFVQVRPAQGRAVPVHRFSQLLGHVDLGQHLRVPIDHGPEVHDLAQGDTVRPAHHFQDLVPPQDRPGGLPFRAGHAGRRGEVEAQGRPLSVLDHEPDALHPRDVGDLMGIGDHRRGPM